MQFCMPHWETLKTAIKDRGLYALVADNGEGAMSNIASELTDGPSIDNFEPLMGAHNAIISNLMKIDPGVFFIDGCPLCYANKMHSEGCTVIECEGTAYYDKWIDNAADDMVAAWKSFNEN